MSLDHATVRRIASLARIRVEDHEVEPLCQELNGILGWIEQLNEVDVTGVAPLTGASNMAPAGGAATECPLAGHRIPAGEAGQRTRAGAGLGTTPMRADAVTDGGYPDKVLAQCARADRRLLRRAEGRGMMLTDLTIAAGSRWAARGGEFSAVELTMAHLHAIEALNPRLNAYITVSHARAVDQARAADAALAAGDVRPLTGIPLAIKDLFCTEGVRTTAGSKILGPFVPPYESTVTANLLRDGAVFLGKTNLDEFAMGSSNMTSAYGPVENPWKRRQDAAAVLVPGGSSGGSAAAVAARLAMGGTGTDTGGSIRQPASFCGLVGVKPTYGRCSRWGVVAFASSLDHPGPFARTVRDSAILLGSMAGHDPKDFDQRERAGAGFRGGVRTRGEGPADRRAEGIPLGRDAGRDRCAVAAGRGLAARRRRGDRRCVTAAYKVWAGDLLYRGAGGGFVESVAVRRGTVRGARARPGLARFV